MPNHRAQALFALGGYKKAAALRMDQPLSGAIEHLERSMIQYALKLTGDIDNAAQMLGLSRKGLYLKRQRLGLSELSASDDKAADGPPAHDSPHESPISAAHAVSTEPFRKAPISRF